MTPATAIEKPLVLSNVHTARLNSLVHLNNMLMEIDTANDAETAVILAQNALDAGWLLVGDDDIIATYGELIREIESHLPKPTPQQFIAGSMTKCGDTKKFVICRVVGAFGNKIVILKPNIDPRLHKGRKFIFVAIIAEPDITQNVPIWARATRPEKRRIWHPETIQTQQEAAT